MVKGFESAPRSPAYELRDYQEQCLDIVERNNEDGAVRQLVVMATGTGKTITAVEEIRRRIDKNPQTRVLWLCHLKDVLNQSRAECEKWLDAYDISTDRVDSRKVHDQDTTVTFGLFQMMRNVKDSFSPDDFDMIVVDETHHIAAPTYRSTFEYFQPDLLLGITATPDRKDRDDIRKFYDGGVAYRYDTANGIADGYLCPIDYHVVSVAGETEDESGVSSIVDVGSLGVFESTTRQAFYRKVLDHIDLVTQQNDITDPRILVFCPNISLADEFASMGEGFTAYHSDMSAAGRRSVLRDFDTGTLKGMTAVAAADEGINVPEVNIVVFLSTTQSDTRFQQRLWRGLRATEGKQKLVVLDFVDNYGRLLQVQRSEDDRFDAGSSGGQKGGEDDDGQVEKQQFDLGASLGPRYSKFVFDSDAQDALVLLQKIQGDSRQRECITRWDNDDSMRWYKWLSQRLGRVATREDIASFQDQNGSPTIWQLTRGFDGSLPKLRAAAGVETQPSRRQEITRHWTEADSIRHYKQMASTLGKLPSSWDIDNAIKTDSDPTSYMVIRPFKNIHELRKACGFPTISIEDITPESELAEELGYGAKHIRKIANQIGVEVVFGSSPNGMRPGYSSQGITQLREAIPIVPFADDSYIGVNECATTLEVSRKKLKDQLARIGMEGAVTVLRNPQTKRPIEYLPRSVVERVASDIETTKQDIKIRPQDSYSVEEFAEEFGISYQTVIARFTRLNLRLDEYWLDESRTRKGLRVTSKQFDVYCQEYDK